MSGIIDSINSFNSSSNSSTGSDPIGSVNTASANLTAAINSKNPDMVRLALAQNFSDIITKLMSSDDDQEQNNSNDIFSMLENNTAPTTATNTSNLPTQTGLDVSKLF